MEKMSFGFFPVTSDLLSQIIEYLKENKTNIQFHTITLDSAIIKTPCVYV